MLFFPELYLDAEQACSQEEDAKGVDPSIAQYGLSPNALAQCKDDLELAIKLQEEFDREYEMSLKTPEEKEVKS